MAKNLPLVEREISVKVRGIDGRSVPGRFTQKTVKLIDQEYGKRRLEQQQEAAKERRNQWQKLSAKEQLAELDRRLGYGQGAAKQRLRINQAIDVDRIKEEDRVKREKAKQDQIARQQQHKQKNQQKKGH